jgi:hypothetical protein
VSLLPGQSIVMGGLHVRKNSSLTVEVVIIGLEKPDEKPANTSGPVPQVP